MAVYGMVWYLLSTTNCTIIFKKWSFIVEYFDCLQSFATVNDFLDDSVVSLSDTGVRLNGVYI